MKSTRRSLRNHHGKPSEHGAHDPLRIYMPPLMEWSRSKGGERAWTHPELGWRFVISQRVGWVTMPHGDDWQEKEWFDGKSPVAVHGKMREWYAQQTPTSLRRLSERNPDWSAMRAKASHYGERAVAGARSAYDWTAPRARAAYDWTAPRARAAGHAAWEGTKAAGRAVKRGAKRAAPVIARGAKSAAERMDRWAAEPNGGVRGAKRLGSYILRYSSTLGSPESTVGMAFYQGRSIARSIAQEALRDLKWQLDFDTHWAGRPWRRGEKKHLASTINSLEAAIKRAG